MLVFIAFVCSLIGYFSTLFIIKLLKKTYIPKYNMESFEKKLKRTPEYIFSNKYSYIPHKRIITIKKNKNYSVLDLFFYYHEYGHYLDDKNNKITYLLILETINRFILIPLTLLLVLISNKSCGYCINIMFIFLIFRLYFLVKYERRASNYAREILKSSFKLSNKKLVYISYIALFCQIFESFVFFFLVMMGQTL